MILRTLLRFFEGFYQDAFQGVSESFRGTQELIVGIQVYFKGFTGISAMIQVLKVTAGQAKFP